MKRRIDLLRWPGLTKLFKHTPLTPSATLATMAKMAVSDQSDDALSKKKNRIPERLPIPANKIKRNLRMMAAVGGKKAKAKNNGYEGASQVKMVSLGSNRLTNEARNTRSKKQ
jgi:hypothetical protein